MLVFVSDSIDLDLNCCSFRESGHFLSFEKVDELYLKKYHEHCINMF